jgi:hypothetical protein
VNLFLRPGPLNWVTETPVPVTVVYGVPPVWLRLVRIGFVSVVQAGHALAGFAVPEGLVDDLPFASVLLREGLFCVMKFPYIPKYDGRYLVNTTFSVWLGRQLR